MGESQDITASPTLQPVFVTGGGTSIGRETIRQLAAVGYRVTATATTQKEAQALRALGALPTYPDFNRMGEIRTALRTADAGLIINLSPQIANHAPVSPAAWNERLSQETVALFRAAEEVGIEFIVHTSYAFAGSESQAAGAVLQSARRAERVALKSSIPACVLRLGYIYGAGSPELIAMRDALRLGRGRSPGSEVAAGWVYESDAARALILALQMRPAGATLTIVDDHPQSPSDFMHYFAETQGLGVPGRVPGFAARLFSSQTQRAVMDIPLAATNADARTTLGWQPRYADTRAGIDELLLTWRADAAQAVADQRAVGANTSGAATQQAMLAAGTTNNQTEIAKSS